MAREEAMDSAVEMGRDSRELGNPMIFLFFLFHAFFFISTLLPIFEE